MENNHSASTVRPNRYSCVNFLALLFIYPLSFFLFLSGCSYSFTGSSVPPHLKTIAVPLFDDQSGVGEAGLREMFTNRVIDRFVRDNSLSIADRKEADSMLECAILTVRDEPAVISRGETVSKLRLTVIVKASYHDLKLRKRVWEKQLSNWGDYDLGGGPSGRQSAINTAIEKLSEDLLLETVSGW